MSSVNFEKYIVKRMLKRLLTAKKQNDKGTINETLNECSDSEKELVLKLNYEK